MVALGQHQLDVAAAVFHVEMRKRTRDRGGSPGRVIAAKRGIGLQPVDIEAHRREERAGKRPASASPVARSRIMRLTRLVFSNRRVGTALDAGSRVCPRRPTSSTSMIE